MKKHKYKIIIATCAFIFICGIIGSTAVLLAPKTDAVNIMRDGEVLYSFDLSKAEDTTFDIEYNGSSNTVKIENGKICISRADCPDQTCVHTGWLSSSAVPIVCLPNHLVIEFTDRIDEADAVVG